MSELDEQVAKAYSAWDQVQMALGEQRLAYDQALAMHMKGQGEDPQRLREEIQQSQVRCDQLFFAFLRVAEARTRERYL
jgi:hypothetical protein